MLRKIALLSSPSSLLEQPNFVFIMTDDQDLHLNSLDYMPKLKHLIADEGTVFEKHFCTIAVCCPSRVSLMTGKLAHNTNVTDVNPPYGGYPKFIQEGHNEDYLPVWLQESGYNTYYTGKFLNAHTTSNYDNPFPKGWNGTDYCYWNSTFQRNHDVPVASNGYSTDLITQNSLRFIKEAHASDRPFFIGIAPIAPHAKSVQAKADAIPYFLSPVPAERHKEMFPNAKVPRGANFNPGTPSGASWVHDLSRLNATDLDYMDSFYRARLQSLQAVDELVENVILQLEESRLLENTYIFYTSDNGYHIGQHRLVPGKGCPYEEDINIPMMIRGPGVPKESFDGLPIPLLEARIEHTREVRKREHVSVEYWGQNLQEGEIGTDWTTETPVIYGNNTYKAMRVIGDSYNLFYSVWCTNEHELYDHKNDPYQMDNLFSRSNVTILGRELDKVVSRLDTLLLVLKSCKGAECTLPWETIHPDKTVTTLSEALDSKYDEFYAAQPDISFSSCELGYLPQI
ncbi:Arylsulphatase [Aspergillus caelatus]|uniref:Arylsulphatase n=1 Tax=Aspergillus caelatus TaxID=61420 RepID=A0A5N6ZRY1_9EURO|nr:Arylsulphatase [Aspergillus caelatus]KAE8358950.1 Arylsulphatase [Aspergillus caelatus]